jgi:hypothetical protein
VRRVHQLLAIVAFCVGGTGGAFGCEFAISDWQVVPVPEDQHSEEFSLWESAANYSKHEWAVYRDGNTLCARLLDRPRRKDPFLPFVASVESFREARAAVKVSDGWLVGFNRGEWGGALYWFNSDGTQRYKISDHQIVSFLQSGGSIFAIEGLAHLGPGRGSIVTLSKPTGAKRWTTKSFLTLPRAPYAFAMHSSGKLYIVLEDSLVSVDRKRHLATVYRDAAWALLYPNSLVLEEESARAYVGMRQFVGEVSLVDGTAKFGIPDQRFLNRLPKDDEISIRRQYGG